MTNQLTKIAIFGTSADPPTIAHQRILQWLGQNFDFVAVYASDNPFKHHCANIYHRAAMLQLLIDDLDIYKNKMELCQDIGDRRSLITINKSREKWGMSAEFYLVIGSDLITQILKWYQIEELLSKVTVLIMPRPNLDITKESLKNLENLGGKYQIAKTKLPAISSTKYRQKKDQNIIIESVKNYIKVNNIYQEKIDN